MAERKRRGGQAGSGRQAGAAGGSRRDEDVDEAVVDAEETAAIDEADEVDDGDLADEELDAEGAPDGDGVAAGRSGGTATATRAKPAAPADKKRTREKNSERRGLFAWLAGLGPRLVDFIREVVAELRKVIWPTRTELVTYTSVVVVFVVMMLTIVGLLDVGFAKGVLWVFGSNGSSSGN